MFITRKVAFIYDMAMSNLLFDKYNYLKITIKSIVGNSKYNHKRDNVFGHSFFDLFSLIA